MAINGCGRHNDLLCCAKIRRRQLSVRCFFFTCTILHALDRLDTRVCTDADTGIGIDNTGIRSPIRIPIRDIADMTILNNEMLRHCNDR